MNKKIRIIFAGTPEFAVPYLEGFFSDGDFEVLGVITQPDKPAGRKQELLPPPIKVSALKREIKIWQPEKMKTDQQLLLELKNIGADALVVVAYGQIIPKEVLELFPLGGINVHPSLLPKYRGASPIQNAILNGESQTGVCIMQMDEKMDHGPILACQEVDLSGEETNESLHGYLAELGVPLLLQTIKDFAVGKISPQEQNHESATFCSVISREQSRIDWLGGAKKIKQMIYAFYPWPIAWTMLDGKRVKIFPPINLTSSSGAGCGEIVLVDGEIGVACSDGILILSDVQIEGKNRMAAKDFILGYKDFVGKKFE